MLSGSPAGGVFLCLFWFYAHRHTARHSCSSARNECWHRRRPDVGARLLQFHRFGAGARDPAGMVPSPHCVAAEFHLPGDWSGFAVAGKPGRGILTVGVSVLTGLAGYDGLEI